MISAEVLFDIMEPEYEYVEDQMSAIESWCHSHIGPRAKFSDQVNEDRPWGCREQFGWVRFQFARESDATMFKLKWMR